MPSTTRGSILISTANDIGEALVEKLGGVGYSPNEWKEKYNLCGIAPIDSAPALSVLADSAGTGDERGSILIATADAIGAILNKKYNVLRGFKPKEWASACRKMKALEEGSVASASIASFSDGADDVPTKSLVVTIPANLSGVSSVTETQTGKNLIPFAVDYPNFTQTKNGMTISVFANGKVKFNGTTTASTDFPFYSASAQSEPHLFVKSGTYTFSNIGSDSVKMVVSGGGNNGFPYREIVNGSYTGTVTDDTKPFNYIIFRIASGVQLDNAEIEPMLEYGSTATTFEPYTAPTTYTASLGRTIYGGTADIVNGEGTDGYGYVDLGSLTWTKRNTSSGHWRFTTQDVPVVINDDSSHIPSMDCIEYTAISPTQSWTGVKGVSCNTSISQLIVCDESYETESDFKTAVSGVYLVYPLATPTDFTFTGQEVNTRLGYNAFWSEQGDTAVEYYQAPTPYTRKTATGGIANFSDQRTDLPLTKAIANIAPSIAGKSSVNLIRTGRNLLLPHIEDISETTLNGIKRSYSLEDQEFTFTGTNTKTDAAWLIYSLNAGDFVLNGLKPGATYCFSHNLTADMYAQVTYNKTGGGIGSMGYLRGNAGQNASVSFTLPSDFDSLRGFQIGVVNTATSVNVTAHFQIEVGSSASAYEQYQAPTTYTAELGETVYGGSVDFVSGEVVKDCTKDSMSSSYLSGLSLETYIGYEEQTAYFGYHPSVWVRNWNYQTAAARTAGGIKCACDEFPASMNNTTIFASQYRIYFDVNGKNISSVQDFIDYVANLEQNGKQLEITYELATPTESEIPGRVISPIEGVNNYWNDAGGDTEIQYFEDET